LIPGRSRMTRESHVRFLLEGCDTTTYQARQAKRSTELHSYSPGLCTGGWLPVLDLPILQKIPGSIWFSIKVILFLFLYIWVRAAFPRYRYDQLMGLGWKVFLPLSLARVVAVSGLLVTFRWLP
jgi:hypothetical protein